MTLAASLSAADVIPPFAAALRTLPSTETLVGLGVPVLALAGLHDRAKMRAEGVVDTLRSIAAKQPPGSSLRQVIDNFSSTMD